MIAQIRPAHLAAWTLSVQSIGRPVVLDVREPGELATVSLKVDAGPNGFDLLAIPMNSVPARLAELDASRPIACLCHHGARSQRVAAFLEAQGFAQVVNIAGGIDAWAQELDASLVRY